MNCKAVIFDLDGTLLDTLADLAHAANRVLANHGYPTHPENAFNLFVGDGSKLLMTRALPVNQRRPAVIDACLNEFIADYKSHWADTTKPYDGMMDLIEALVARAIHLSVVTNKPHRFTGVMMDHYFKGLPFFPIVGQQAGIPKKPHPQQALAAADKMGVMPAACVFLGDSAVDMETAVRAGMQPVGAGWGFRSAQELRAAGAIVVLEHPLDLLQVI
jgi:phosphoglycolate phosphatase